MKFKADNLAEAPERLGFEEIKSPQKGAKGKVHKKCRLIFYAYMI